jgi:carboxypeptidase C (cathepsin A)
LFVNNNIKNSTKKIAVASTISFMISMIIFLIFMNYVNPVIVNENNFFNQEFSDKKKIYLIGSSYVGQINANIVNQNLKNNNEDHLVYNLAIHSDKPEKRIGTIDKIIETNPEMVIYGISFGDLGEFDSQSPLEIRQYFEKIFPIKELVDIRQNPRDITLDFILNVLSYSSFSERDQFNPFYPQNIPVMSQIKTNAELEVKIDNGLTSIISNIPNYDINKNAISLEKIFQKLRQNDIEIIVYTTPYSRAYLEHTNPEMVDEFYNLLNMLVSKYEIKLYDLQNEYADLEIWAESSHVAYNNINSTIYADDISKIILKEIED